MTCSHSSCVLNARTPRMCVTVLAVLLDAVLGPLCLELELLASLAGLRDGDEVRADPSIRDDNGWSA
jgi:hypothetical protein